MRLHLHLMTASTTNLATKAGESREKSISNIRSVVTLSSEFTVHSSLRAVAKNAAAGPKTTPHGADLPSC